MELSIIIVTYNSENDIKKCIDSIIEKTSRLEYEIVVVDNSSKDNTRKVVKSIMNKYSNISLYDEFILVFYSKQCFNKPPFVIYSICIIINRS